jgi:hypothetical protein
MFCGVPVSEAELVIWYKSIITNHLEEGASLRGAFKKCYVQWVEEAYWLVGY